VPRRGGGTGGLVQVSPPAAGSGPPAGGSVPLTGTSRQQQRGSPQGAIRAPASTMQPHSAHAILIWSPKATGRLRTPQRGTEPLAAIMSDPAMKRVPAKPPITPAD